MSTVTITTILSFAILWKIISAVENSYIANLNYKIAKQQQEQEHQIEISRPYPIDYYPFTNNNLS